MFGKKNNAKREQELYEQSMQKARGLLKNAERYPDIQKSAAREAREQVQHEQSIQEARALLREMEGQVEIQASARRRLQDIVKGLQHDGIQPDTDLMQRLAHLATEGYIKDHCRQGLDRAHVNEVFETEYREALKSRTFFNPFTGEIEEW